MSALLKFELGAFLKRPGIYIVFFLLLAMGFFIGLKLSFSPGNEIHRNSPYAIANMVGLLSLCNIFIITVLASQMLLRERDTGFSLILYATPVSKTAYLISRFTALLMLSLLCFGLLILGYLLGHLADPDRGTYGPFILWHYFQPFLLLGLPNLLLCAVMVSSVAWISQSKLYVYLTGLFIYIIYLVLLTYSGSPMMAGALPQSAQALRLSAQVDPFGLSAFYEQTNLWEVAKKNSDTLNLTGNVLLNRLGYLIFSLLILLIAFLRFKFVLQEDSKRKRKTKDDKGPLIERSYQPIEVRPVGWNYSIQSLWSLVGLELKVLIKSIPFFLIALSLVFYLSMEFYGSIDQGIRLPQQYASSALMVNRILYNLPGLLMIIVLFYVHELYWRSKDSRFDLIEGSTPAAPIFFVASKWISLSIVLILLTTIVICTGIGFQILFDYSLIEWKVYLTLYWLICAPLMVGLGAVLLLQRMINHKWVGLLVSSFFIVLLSTSFGKSLGITSPLLRFPASYAARYSEMNGWDDYLRAFSWRMVFGISLLSSLSMAMAYGFRRLSPKKGFALAGTFLVMIFSGTYIFNMQDKKPSAAEALDRLACYEQRYRKFQDFTQPVVTSVKTTVDLEPAQHAYHVSGTYTIINKGRQPITELLVNFHDALEVGQVIYQAGSIRERLGSETGLYRLKNALLPGDGAVLTFSFSYQWNGFTGHEPFNAIVDNGSFLRISNYFPSFGYQADLEIANLSERRKRHLGDTSPLKKLQAPRGRNDFIDLDMTVSIPKGQRIIGVGRLERAWDLKERSYFHYLSDSPIPFRFGLSAAAYKLKRLRFKGVDIEVYFEGRHYENVDRLLKNAARTIKYCERNFGPYPYKTLRFAEISSFTDGFAGTAYPATIFMTEQFIFHNNLRADRNQDVINELAAHEVSHQWWGNAQLSPDEREGSKVLTETMAMYTELMLAEHFLGSDAAKDKVSIHNQIYLNERGFGKEVPLYLARPQDTHLYYSKGLVVMWQLKQLIGEKTINRALRNLLKKHRYPAPSPVSGDLLIELHQVSDTSLHQKIDSLFVR
ncbi:M1 family aminopeptidase [Pedobacter frigidisoli]|uniref:M1 family aminopeptidase n=1 Tax=Pedobacter frigidisoli TaxID=2530455 RepID=UPI00292FBC1F|nr:M1 family aminopeptidase [Pedobacter frigidisoli]